MFKLNVIMALTDKFEIVYEEPDGNWLLGLKVEDVLNLKTTIPKLDKFLLVIF